MMALGQALFMAGAQAEQPWSMTGPTTKAFAASRLLFYNDAPAVRQSASELATQAVSRAPLSPAAIGFLAHGSDGARREALLKVIGRLGWQERATQRVLYNAAISDGNVAAAMDRIEAAIRQDHSLDFLQPTILQSLGNAGYAAEFVEIFRQSGEWADGYLLRFGHRLPDDVLSSIFRERALQGERDIVLGQVAAKLLSDDRLTAAAKLRDIALPGPKSVPDFTAKSASGPFGWRLGNGYALDTQSSHLRRSQVAGARPALVVLSLEPGRYKLVPQSAAADIGDWRWGIACYGSRVRAETFLASSTSFEVPANCPIQELAVALAIGDRDAPTLAPLQIVAEGER